MSVIHRLTVAGIALGVLAAAVAGAGTPARDRAWAGDVERWVSNWQAAGAAGIPNLGAFLAADVTVDHRGAAEGGAQGRDAALAFYRAVQDRHRSAVLQGPAYVSTSGMVVLSHWMLALPHGALTTEVRQDAALTLAFSAGGLSREDAALSLLSARVHDDFDQADPPVPVDWAPLTALAARYLQVWSQADASAVAALYDDAAQVRDSLLGVRLDGPAAVRRASARQSRLHVSLLRDLGGPAVFGEAAGQAAPFERAVLLVEPDDPASCPGHTAVVLSLSPAGTVIREERYHRLDDARRCVPPDRRPGGWWDTVAVPDPVQLERTGTLDVTGKRVEVWNATPQLDQLLRWAFGRFDAAGLPPPAPRSITFYPAAPDRCAFNAGLASGAALTELTLCFGTREACTRHLCPPWTVQARRVVLHELAHTWMAQHLTDDVREQYVARVHLRWNDPADAWGDRGIERAADTIAWGLMDESLPLPQLGQPPQDELATEFRLLTGSQPLRTTART